MRLLADENYPSHKLISDSNIFSNSVPILMQETMKYFPNESIKVNISRVIYKISNVLLSITNGLFRSKE